MGVINSIDPRTGNVIDTVAESTDPPSVKRICQSAAQATGQLNEMAPEARADLLEAMAAKLEQHRQRLVLLADAESALGKPRLDSELSRTTGQLRLFSNVLREGTFCEAIIDHASTASPDIRRMLAAIGPVAVFGASNFPFAFSAAGGDTASALAAGCAVVVKAHGAHPALDSAVVEILREACLEHGAPADTISVIYGREAGKNAVQDSNIQAVGFTGSESVGRLLMDIAAARKNPIPVYAEMGSLNPLIVSPGATRRGDALAQTIADSILLGAGQFCTKPGIVFVPVGETGDHLVSQLAARVAAAEDAYLLSSTIRDAFVERTTSIASRGTSESLVTPISGAGSSTTAALSQVSIELLHADDEYQSECFGPGALVVRYSTSEDVAAAVPSLPASLTMSVFVDDAEADFARDVIIAGTTRVGRLIFNDVPTGVAVNWAQHHGGPYPASSNGMFTSVGATATRRFMRPLAYQSFPENMLPSALKTENPLNIPRRVNGILVLAK